MGVSQSEAFPFLRKYQYVQEAYTTCYGRVSLYRKKEIGYDYVAVIKRLVTKQLAPSIEAEIAYLASLGAMDSFLRVHGVTSSAQKGFSDIESRKHQQKQNFGVHHCVTRLTQDQQISICFEYFTYSLCEHLHFMRRSQRQISPEQYVMVMRTSIKAATECLEWKLTYLELQIQCTKILVTTQGEVKLMPFYCKFLKEQEENTCCLPENSCTGNFSSKVTMHGNWQKKGRQVSLKKYLKQLKMLSTDMLTSISTSLLPRERMKKSGVLGSGVLTEREQDLLIRMHNSIIKAQTLQEMSQGMEGVDESPLYVRDFSATPSNQSSPSVEKKALIPLSHNRARHSQQTEESLVYSNSSSTQGRSQKAVSFSSSHLMQIQNNYRIQ